MAGAVQPAHPGRCLCGAVSYEASGSPTVLIICHCTFCQRATGSAYMVEPIWREQDFRVTAGTPRRYEARSQTSGKRINIHFCESCGTKLFQTLERFQDVVGVYGGTLDEPSVATEAGATWRVFLDNAQKNTVIPPGVDVWGQHRFDAAGATTEPFRYDDFHIV